MLLVEPWVGIINTKVVIGKRLPTLCRICFKRLTLP